MVACLFAVLVVPPLQAQNLTGTLPSAVSDGPGAAYFCSSRDGGGLLVLVQGKVTFRIRMEDELLSATKHDLASEEVGFVLEIGGSRRDAGKVSLELFNDDRDDLSGAVHFDRWDTGGVFSAQNLGAEPRVGDCTPVGKRRYLNQLGATERQIAAVSRGEITIGMSSELVVQALGWPTSAKRAVTANGVTEMWWYGNSMLVTLFRGRVVKWVE